MPTPEPNKWLSFCKRCTLPIDGAGCSDCLAKATAIIKQLLLVIPTTSHAKFEHQAMIVEAQQFVGWDELAVDHNTIAAWVEAHAPK